MFCRYAADAHACARCRSDAAAPDAPFEPSSSAIFRGDIYEEAADDSAFFFFDVFSAALMASRYYAFFATPFRRHNRIHTLIFLSPLRWRGAQMQDAALFSERL